MVDLVVMGQYLQVLGQTLCVQDQIWILDDAADSDNLTVSGQVLCILGNELNVNTQAWTLDA